MEQFFQRVVSYNPTQVLRYQYGTAEEGVQPLWCSVLYPGMFTHTHSHPLLASAESSSTSSCSAVGATPRYGDEMVSHCPGCGARRVFEFQLMPALISYFSKLKVAADKSAGTGLEFGVVAVYVCPNSCSGSFLEQAVVQAPSDMIVLE